MAYSFTTAVAGTGFIGPVHVEALTRLGVRVKGILGSSPQKSEKARAALGLEKAYESYEEMLQDPDLDSIHIATPNVLHFEMAKAALEAGKHILCEKPLAMTSQETEELVGLAQLSGLHAGVCYNIRYYPLNREARAQVQGGSLGEIYSVVGSYVQDWLLYETDYNWRVLSEQSGALRAIADIGTHWMDLVYSITGLKVSAVLADLQTVHSIRKRPKGEVETFSGKVLTEEELEPVSIDTEDAGSVLFRFANGAKGQLWVSQVTAGRKNCVRYEIAGASSSLGWNSESPNELWIGQRNSPNQVLLKDPGLLQPTASHYVNYPGGHNEGFPDSFKQCFRSFYDAIVQNLPLGQVEYPTFSEGHKEVVLCEAILKSHREERWVTIPT